MSEYDVGGDASLESGTFSGTYSDPDSDLNPDPSEFVADDDAPSNGDTAEYYDSGVKTVEPATDFSVDSLPTELRFGALIGPDGETNDPYAEDIYYSTTADSYYGEESGREIDQWTGWEKT